MKRNGLLINAYCFALMGPSFLLMSSTEDSIIGADNGSLVNRHTNYIKASVMASNIVNGL